jgi:hypothetical protein
VSHAQKIPEALRFSKAVELIRILVHLTASRRAYEDSGNIEQAIVDYRKAVDSTRTTRRRDN